MEDWLDFDYRQMPEVQNPMQGNMAMMPWCQGMMPYQQMPMPYQQMPMPAGKTEMKPTPAGQVAGVAGQTAGVPGTIGQGTSPFEMAPGSPVVQNRNFFQGYLRTQIGKSMRIEFLIGTNILTDRSGTLVEVGVDHVALVPFNSSDLIVADLYSIKFVTVYGGASQYPELVAASSMPR